MRDQRPSIPCDEIKAALLADPGVNAEYDKLAPVYDLIVLRIKHGWTPEGLAKKAGVRARDVVRLEKLKGSPTLALLHRLANAMDYQIVVRVTSEEDALREMRRNTAQDAVIRAARQFLSTWGQIDSTKTIAEIWEYWLDDLKALRNAVDALEK
jgi:transcriptional regulator with XRE-family HTH domain